MLPFIYEKAHAFHEELASVKLNGKWGFINNKGLIKICCKYDFAFSFWKGFASVQLNKKDGYVNREGLEYWED